MKKGKKFLIVLAVCLAASLLAVACTDKEKRPENEPSAPIAVSPAQTPNNVSAVYGDTLADIALTEFDDAYGKWSWKDEASTSVGAVGERTFTAVYLLTDPDKYVLADPSDGSADVTVTVAKRMLTLEWTGTETRVYDGSASAVSVAATNCVAGDTIDLTVTGGAAIDAGIHTATVQSIENANYALPDSLTKTYSIEKATPSVSLLEYSIPNDHTTAGPVFGIGEVKLKSDTMTGLGTVVVKYDGKTELPTAAGTYAVTVDIAEGDNFTAAVIPLGEYTIADAYEENRAEAIDELQNYKPYHDYHAMQQGEMDAVLAEAGNAIASAVDLETIATVVTETKETLDLIPTAAEIDAAGVFDITGMSYAGTTWGDRLYSRDEQYLADGQTFGVKIELTDSVDAAVTYAHVLPTEKPAGFTHFEWKIYSTEAFVYNIMIGSRLARIEQGMNTYVLTWEELSGGTNIWIGSGLTATLYISPVVGRSVETLAFAGGAFVLPTGTTNVCYDFDVVDEENGDTASVKLQPTGETTAYFTFPTENPVETSVYRWRIYSTKTTGGMLLFGEPLNVQEGWNTFTFTWSEWPGNNTIYVHPDIAATGVILYFGSFAPSAN